MTDLIPENVEYLIVLIVGVVTALLCYVSDARVFDLNGKRIPGPDSHFSSPNPIILYKRARRDKRASEAINEVILPLCGDGITASFSVPFASLDVSNFFRRRVVILTDPAMIKAVLTARAVDVTKSNTYNRLKFAMGNGLLTAPLDV
jgi:hypothetical protein